MLPFLHVKQVSKTFGGTKALNGASLELLPGEVHALLGLNGCGKSTLIKVLAGIHPADHGAVIEVQGRQMEFTPRHSHNAGLRFVHQDLGLMGSLSAAENLELTARRPRAWFSDRALHDRAREMCAANGVNLDVKTPVQYLSRAQQSLIAIVRAISDLPSGKGLLVLDEPTASLPPADVAILLEAMRAIKSRGLAVLLVTHRLEEVFASSDQITVLRDGRTVHTCMTADATTDGLTTAIVGSRSSVSEKHVHTSSPPHVRGTGSNAGRAIEVKGLRATRVHDVDFSARPGEILGLTGLLGSGYEELLAHVFGAKKRTAGTITVDQGHVLPDGRCDRSVHAGVGYVPSDRDRLGSIPEWTIAENLTLPAIPVRRLRLLNRPKERSDSKDWIGRLEVVPAEAERKLAELSGGNRQRIALGRWLRRGCKVLLLDEPTIGVDVAGKRRIYALLRDAADSGVAVVVASSDHPELLELCDRILVLRQGRVVAEYDRADATEERLFHASVGSIAEPAQSA